MSQINVMSVNINGLKSSIKRFRLMKMARMNKVDFLFVTETHRVKGQGTKMINDMNWKLIYETFGNSKSKGVAIMIHKRVNFQLLQIQKDKEGRLLFVKGQINKQKITLAAIYAPNVNTKHFVFNAKRKLDKFSEGLVIFAGDFNIEIKLDMDQRKQISLKSLNMLDPHEGLINRRTFYSASHNKFSCLDYIFINKMEGIHIEKAEIDKDWISDHAPIRLNLKIGEVKKRSTWRFNQVVTLEDCNKEKLEKDIQEYFQFNDLEELSQAVIWDAKKAVIRGKCISMEAFIRKKWAEDTNRRLKEIEEIREILKITKDREWYQRLKIKQKQFEEIEEIKWNKLRLASRQKIESWGRKSVKQLANYLKRRKEKSVITVIKNQFGEEKYGNEEIGNTLREFYKQLYEEEQVQVGEIKVYQRVSEAERLLLNQNISKAEIIHVIKNLKPGKAPGPDGFSGEYYKIFMDVLVPHLEKLYNNVLEKREIPRSWKCSEIILIPKVGRDLKEPGSYRPISLLNQDYKIFMKILANRMENILPRIVGKDQYGFVKGRKIYEPIRNIVNALHHAHVNKRKLGLLKLDIYKAFDKVNHQYLIKLCEQLEMGDTFCQVIKEIYSNNIASIRVNGNSTREFEIRNGTKQGCPLSPLLFALAIETLANKIRGDEKWEGYQIGQSVLKLNLFADDAIIVTQTPIEMAKQIKLILQEFKEQSGLSVNLEKSEILCINTGPREQLDIRKQLGVKLGIKRFKYLGIWLLKNPEQIAEVNYNLIWNKMKKQMKRWEKKKKLRRMAKIRALKMMIIPKMLYILQVVPGTIATRKLKEWDNLINRWIEGGRRPRIKRKWMIAREESGGWGHPSLELYRDSYQIDRLIDLQLFREKFWVKFERGMNNIKEEELICKKWERKEIKILYEPIKAVIECWIKWQGMLDMRSSKMASLRVINNKKEYRLERCIKILEQNNIVRIEQLYDPDGKVRKRLIEQYLGQGNWLQILAIVSYLNGVENKSIFLRQDIEMEKVIKHKIKRGRAEVSTIYKLLIQGEENIIVEITKNWQEELDVNEWEMEGIIENIKRIKNTRVREMRRKILHKWYYTPTQLARFHKGMNGNCWHGCSKKGVYMHMFWECVKVQAFWIQVQTEIENLTNIKWVITKEVALLVKNSELGDEKVLKIAAIESAQSTIVLGWKDSKQWNIENWCKYMVEHIHFQIMEIKLNYDQEKMVEELRRWEKVKDYLSLRITDLKTKKKLLSLYER